MNKRIICPVCEKHIHVNDFTALTQEGGFYHLTCYSKIDFLQSQLDKTNERVEKLKKALEDIAEYPMVTELRHVVEIAEKALEKK